MVISMEFLQERILTSRQFVRTMHESMDSGERFCFILGSGASVESDIPSGNKLEMKWMDHIMGSEKNIADVRKTAAALKAKKLIEHPFDEIEAAWNKAKENNTSIPSEYYFDIYKLRFYPSQSNGYRYLERIMEKSRPSLGYRTLAKLLTDTDQHNLVITTNFDSLVEDALFLYSDKRPLVVGHESLVGYIDSDIRRPIIAKVHRSLMYAPFNTPETTKELQPEWRDALRYAFSTYTPVFIGYAGGDQSLMAFLEEETTLMRKGVYWCYWKKGGEPDQRIRDFVIDKKGCLVPILGFDALMLEIGTEMFKDEITPTGTEKYLRAQYEARIQKYNEQYDELNKNQQPEVREVLQPINEAEQAEAEKRAETDTLTAWDYLRRGGQAFDEKRYQDAILAYTAAIDKDPDLGAAYNLRGYAYNKLGQYSEAITDFSTAIQLDPDNAVAYRNRGYAYNDLGQHYKAIDDCSTAIQLDHYYANPYRHRGVAYIKLGQHQKAIKDFTQAIQLKPKYKDAYLTRAEAYRAIGEIALAEADEKTAAELDDQ